MFQETIKRDFEINIIKYINMSEPTPMPEPNVFYKELRDRLINDTHDQLVLRNTIYVRCFRQHVIDANNNMQIPFNETELENVMGPLTAFFCTRCNREPAYNSMCLKIAEILDQYYIQHQIYSEEHIR